MSKDDHIEYLLSTVLSVVRLNGDRMMIYDAQGGALPLDYDTAISLLEALTEYTSQGKRYIESQRRSVLEAMWNGEHRQPSLPPNPKSLKGYVYLIKSPTGLFKIGRSKDPETRLRNFDIRLPFEVDIICIVPSDDMKSLESSLHKRYSDRHVNGEWFKLTDEDVEYIKGLANGSNA